MLHNGNDRCIMYHNISKCWETEPAKKVFETQKTKPKGKFEMVLDSFVTVACFIIAGFTVLGIVGAIISLF